MLKNPSVAPITHNHHDEIQISQYWSQAPSA